jgi:hypothetical protein
MIDLVIRAIAIVLDLAINNVALPEKVIVPPERPAITAPAEPEAISVPEESLSSTDRPTY